MEAAVIAGCSPILPTVFAGWRFLFGYDTVVTSWSVHQNDQFGAWKIQVVVSATVLFAAVGSVMGAACRRAAASLSSRSSCFYCLGSLMAAAARGFGELVAGRVALGLAGLSPMAIPVYVAASLAEPAGAWCRYNLFIVLARRRRAASTQAFYLGPGRRAGA